MKKIIFDHEGITIELRRLHEMRYSIYVKDLILSIYLAGDVKPKEKLNKSQYDRILKAIIDYEEAVQRSWPSGTTNRQQKTNYFTRSHFPLVAVQEQFQYC